MKAFLWFMAGTVAGEVMRQLAARIKARMGREKHPAVPIAQDRRPWNLTRDEGQPGIQPPQPWPRK